jgi:hypothetical protein
MSDYAELENDIVVNVVVAESDWVGLTFGVWVAYDNDVNPAMIGSTYNSETNMFEWFDEGTQTWIVLCPPVSG